jgi:hypothetical protein
MAIDIDSAQGWGKAKSPSKFEMTLGPCLGVCIYDRKFRKGYVIHTAAPAHELGWQNLVKRVIEESENISRLEVTLTGMQSQPEDMEFGYDPGDETKNRQYVVDYFLEKGFNPKKLKKRFNNGFLAITTYFDLKTGDVTTEELEDSDIRYYPDLDDF